MSTWLWIVTLTGSVLALWSITWILRAQQTGTGERRLEDDARARVAGGQGWDGPEPPRSFSDAELVALSRSLRPLTLEQAGIVARPMAPVQRKGPGRRRSSSSS